MLALSAAVGESGGGEGSEGGEGGGEGGQQQQQKKGSGWAGSPLHAKSDAGLTDLIDKLGRVTPQMRCRPTFHVGITQMVPATLGCEQGGVVAAAVMNLPCK